MRTCKTAVETRNGTHRKAYTHITLRGNDRHLRWSPSRPSVHGSAGSEPCTSKRTRCDGGHLSQPSDASAQERFPSPTAHVGRRKDSPPEKDRNRQSGTHPLHQRTGTNGRLQLHAHHLERTTASGSAAGRSRQPLRTRPQKLRRLPALRERPRHRTHQMPGTDHIHPDELLLHRSTPGTAPGRSTDSQQHLRLSIPHARQSREGIPERQKNRLSHSQPPSASPQTHTHERSLSGELSTLSPQPSNPLRHAQHRHTPHPA